MWYVYIAVSKKLRFILSVMSDFHMTDSLSLAVHTFAILGWWDAASEIVLEDSSFVWRCHLLIKAHVFCFVLVDTEAYATCRSFQAM